MKQENKFVLPEKWAVKINKELQKKLEYYSAQGYHHSNNEWDIIIIDGFELITFKQYKEHVLKDILNPEYDPKDVAFENDVYSNSEFNSEKKILGYKLIKPEYKEAVKDIVCIHEDGERWFNDRFEINVSEFGYNLESKRGVCDLIKKAGVMHWFEPVYKKESITLKSGVKLSEDDIAEVKEILNTGNRNNNLI